MKNFAHNAVCYNACYSATRAFTSPARHSQLMFEMSHEVMRLSLSVNFVLRFSTFDRPRDLWDVDDSLAEMIAKIVKSNNRIH